MQLERREVVRALRKKYFTEEKGSRNHDFYFLIVDNKRTGIFTKVSRGTEYKTLQEKLIKSMAEQIRLEKTQFVDLVSCSLSGDGYLKILRDTNQL